MAYLKTKRDIAKLNPMAKDLIAKISEDKWEIKQISSLQELQEYLMENPLVHLIIYDICDRWSLEYLPLIRKSYPPWWVMVLADVSVSPMEYVRPNLRVNSLLLKPWEKQQAYDVLFDFFSEYLAYAVNEKKEGLHSYVVESREGTIHLPYDQIYFFEAREKKIYVCTGKEEYGFYSSIDKLSEELPDYFMRCHRGFIVNTKKIRKVVLSQNIIYLSDGFEVPLSRSYKAVLKGMER